MTERTFRVRLRGVLKPLAVALVLAAAAPALANSWITDPTDPMHYFSPLNTQGLYKEEYEKGGKAAAPRTEPRHKRSPDEVVTALIFFGCLVFFIALAHLFMGIDRLRAWWAQRRAPGHIDHEEG